MAVAQKLHMIKRNRSGRIVSRELNENQSQRRN